MGANVMKTLGTNRNNSISRKDTKAMRKAGKKKGRQQAKQSTRKWK